MIPRVSSAFRKKERKKFSINGARDLQKMKFLKKVVHVLTTKKGSILTKRTKKISFIYTN